MKKIFLTLVLLITNSLITNHCLFAHGPWSPWHTTLPIEGKITDATTGEPIENVVIVCRWATTKPAIADNVSGTAAVEVVITDKDGRYRIPGKTTFHFPPLLFIGSWFDGMIISVCHPLYNSSISYRGIHWYENGKWVYKILDEIGNKEHRILEKKDNKIQLDIKLLSLEERYVKKINEYPYQYSIVGPAGDFEGLIESKETGFYWFTLKRKGKSIDVENDFKKWDLIATKLFVGDKIWMMERYNKTKEKIRNNLKKLKVIE